MAQLSSLQKVHSRSGRPSNNTSTVEVAQATGEVPLENERQDVDDDDEGHWIEKSAGVLQIGQATVAKESYVIVVQDGHEPECVTEETGDEPIVVDDGIKKRQL